MANKFFPNYKTYIITSNFGQRVHPVTRIKTMHKGIDIVATNDGKVGQIDKIMAHTGGVVENEGYNLSAGNFIDIKVDDNTTMVYYHMSKRSTFKKGDKVKAGDVIGIMGKTGTATGAHLHWGIKQNGEWIDPAPYLDADYTYVKEPVIANGTVTASVLNIREKPGTAYNVVGTVRKGKEIEIHEKTTFGGATWGRISKGWVCLSNYVKVVDIKQEPEYEMVSVQLPVLNRGAKGEYVKALQTLLIAHGYKMLSSDGKTNYGADGSFGGTTKKCVEKFQSDRGLTVTGSCDAATWTELHKVK